ncbi:hypothetical protein DY000_02012434 [Brassica cretica]|uniref:Uncharacterized protein n=1 Tax=Brassica cretica TaxID=69181 RepID=A0ABQ7D923_BRACR|nr:hypothetical protein DY000_02012434 [Brassica cretica]
MKERSSNTLASQPKPAIILPKTVEQARLTLERIGLVSDLKHIVLLFLANQASIALFGEKVVAPEDSLTGRVEKHAWKQREDGGKGSCFGLPKNLWRKRELVKQAAKVEEAKHPSNGCREEKRFEKKYVRRKKNKKHLESTSTSTLVQKSSNLITMDDDDDAQREQGLYNNGETYSKSEQAEAVDGQGRCSGIENKFMEGDIQEIPKRKRSQRKIEPREIKNWGSSLSERRQGKERAHETIDVPDEEIVISESEDFIPLLLEQAKEKEKGVTNVSRCNQWWNFKTRPRTSRGIRRRVQWSNKRKRNCMTFEETQRNRKILILAVEAVTHQLGLLDVNMEEKSSYK